MANNERVKAWDMDHYTVAVKAIAMTIDLEDSVQP